MRDPELVVGDGAMGLWRALAEVFPAARPQRCWVHKARNVANCLPKSAQPGATKAMQEIYNAEDRTDAEQAIEAFAKTYGAKSPKAVAKITEDFDELLAIYNFPAGALDSLADHQPHRVDLLHGQTPHQGHPRRRQPRGRARWCSS